MTTPLDDERYVSLETFKKDGTAVRTPIWAAPLDDKLVVVTDGTSFKVKRIRNNGKIRAAACDARGKNIHGAWYAGTARVLQDDAHCARADAALKKKYGFQYSVLGFFSRLSGRIKRRAYLEITLEKPN